MKKNDNPPKKYTIYQLKVVSLLKLLMLFFYNTIGTRRKIIIDGLGVLVLVVEKRQKITDKGRK